MRAIDLDFVRRRRIWPYWAAFAAALVLTFFAVRNFLELRQARHEASVTAAPAAQVKLAPTVAPAALQREFDLAKGILVELTLPWDDLFGALEAVAGEQVALLSIEPDPVRGEVRISGEARDYLAALNLVVRLNESEALEHVHLVSHEVRDDNPARPYQFAVLGRWRTQP